MFELYLSLIRIFAVISASTTYQAFSQQNTGGLQFSSIFTPVKGRSCVLELTFVHLKRKKKAYEYKLFCCHALSGLIHIYNKIKGLVHFQN